MTFDTRLRRLEATRPMLGCPVCTAPVRIEYREAGEAATTITDVCTVCGQRLRLIRFMEVVRPEDGDARAV